MGAIPGLPKVHLHNRVLDYSLGGQEYLKPWFAAAEDRQFPAAIARVDPRTHAPTGAIVLMTVMETPAKPARNCIEG